jgi:hypothetical protein
MRSRNLSIPQEVGLNRRKMLIRKENLCEWIEQNKNTMNSTYIDSVLDACEAFGIQEEMMKDFLNIQIISRLEAEAKERNFIKKTSHSIGKFL